MVNNFKVVFFIALQILFISEAVSKTVCIVRPGKLMAAAVRTEVSINGSQFIPLNMKTGIKLFEYNDLTINIRVRAYSYGNIETGGTTQNIRLPQSVNYLVVSPGFLSWNVEAEDEVKLQKIQLNEWNYSTFADAYGIIIPQEVMSREKKSPKEVEDNQVRIRLSGEEKKIDKVAVVGKEGFNCSGEVVDLVALAELVEGELLGIYGVVERMHLNDILKEQKLVMGGLIFEDEDYAKAGCLAGAQGTVIVSIGCVQDKTKMQIKLVDCSTSDIYWSAIGIDVSEFYLLDLLRERLQAP